MEICGDSYTPSASEDLVVAYTTCPSGKLIGKADRERMLGYLDVIIAPPQTAQAEWGNLTLTLYIRDRAGNSSRKVAFPVAMARGVKQANPPSPFNTGELKGVGTIFYQFPVPRGD